MQDMKEELEGIKKNHQELVEEMKSVKQNCEDGKKLTEELPEKIQQNVFSEIRDREERKANFIVHGVPETRDDEMKGEDKKAIDSILVSEICEAIDINLNLDKDVKFIKRLGEVKEDKDRPIVVGCLEKEKKLEITRNSRKLAGKSEFEGIYIVPDLTWQQRKEEQDLNVEAHKRNAELSADQSLNTEWRVVGPRGERRLILGRKRTDRDQRRHLDWRTLAKKRLRPSDQTDTSNKRRHSIREDVQETQEESETETN